MQLHRLLCVCDVEFSSRWYQAWWAEVRAKKLINSTLEPPSHRGETLIYAKSRFLA